MDSIFLSIFCVFQRFVPNSKLSFCSNSPMGTAIAFLYKGVRYFDTYFILSKLSTQPAITCSKLTIETLEQCVKYI